MELTKEKREYLEQLGFGIKKDGKLQLNPYEIKYCIDKDHLENEEKFEGNESVYRVFKDLRDHGIITRFSEDSDLIRVYQKGFRPGEDRTKYVMKVIDGDFPSKEELEKLILISKKMRKYLLIALVGERIDYIKISQTNMY